MDWTMLIDTGMMFAKLMAELLILFVAISFLVGLLQVYVSNETIKRILTRPHKITNSILGAALGSVTPFCSCSTIPILVGLFRSGAPFCGAISFLLTSPILNPATVSLMLMFFGVRIAVIYIVVAITFAVVMGLVLDRLGFERFVKKVKVTGGRDGTCWEDLEGTTVQRHKQAFIIALGDTWGLLRGVLLYLFIGAGIGAFIYGFVPTDLLSGLSDYGILAVPIAALVGIPMYIRTETMIPIASVLMAKGVPAGVVTSLIVGGSGASIPEVSLLASIFDKKMVATFIICVFSMAVIIGYLIMLLT